MATTKTSTKGLYKREAHKDPEIGAFTAIMTYFGYLLMIVVSRRVDFSLCVDGVEVPGRVA
jgi:hypothetical protein